jgi:hypothetical protein
MFRASIVEKGGAKFDGIQRVNGRDKFVLATVPLTLSTYYLQIKGLTKKRFRIDYLKRGKNLRSE